MDAWALLLTISLSKSARSPCEKNRFVSRLCVCWWQPVSSDCRQVGRRARIEMCGAQVSRSKVMLLLLLLPVPRVKTFSFLPLFALRYFSLLSAKSLHYFAGWSTKKMLQVLLNLSLLFFFLSYLCRHWPHKRMCKQIVKRRRFFLVDFVLGGEGGWIFLLPALSPLTLQTFRQKWRERERLILLKVSSTRKLTLKRCVLVQQVPRNVCVLLTPPPPPPPAANIPWKRYLFPSLLK